MENKTLQSNIPPARVRAVNSAPVKEHGQFVLYWMIAYRRLDWNYSLDRALEWSRELNKPLLVLEGLRAGYEWACDRFHRFVLDGMSEKYDRLNQAGVGYFPYAEPFPDAGKGLLQALAEHTCVIITDDYPCFFLPRMVSAASRQVSTRLEAVDSNGLFPLRQTDRVFPTAYAFRRHIQKTLAEHLLDKPQADPLADVSIPEFTGAPSSIVNRWPDVGMHLRSDRPGYEPSLPIDHAVQPTDLKGGPLAANKALADFLNNKLDRYADFRNEPQEEVTSGLSGYLHWGHISTHQIFAEIAHRNDWNLQKLGWESRGKKEGWWGMDRNAEAFLDQLVTWRELGFNMSSLQPHYDRYSSLPDWARETLEKHEIDSRPRIYDLQALEQGLTYDTIWNAAQMQLVREGRIHNYLRMIWGKKILEWSPDPETALETMIHLNNKYAIDGRDPNSYSGIFWILGRYDRPWGPERPIFGKIRYMSSERTAKKYDIKEYVKKYSPCSEENPRK